MFCVFIFGSLHQYVPKVTPDLFFFKKNKTNPGDLFICTINAIKGSHGVLDLLVYRRIGSDFFGT